MAQWRGKKGGSRFGQGLGRRPIRHELVTRGGPTMPLHMRAILSVVVVNLNRFPFVPITGEGRNNKKQKCDQEENPAIHDIPSGLSVDQSSGRIDSLSYEH